MFSLRKIFRVCAQKHRDPLLWSTSLSLPCSLILLHGLQLDAIHGQLGPSPCICSAFPCTLLPFYHQFSRPRDPIGIIVLLLYCCVSVAPAGEMTLHCFTWSPPPAMNSPVGDAGKQRTESGRCIAKKRQEIVDIGRCQGAPCVWLLVFCAVANCILDPVSLIQ